MSIKYFNCSLDKKQKAAVDYYFSSYQMKVRVEGKGWKRELLGYLSRLKCSSGKYNLWC